MTTKLLPFWSYHIHQLLSRHATSQPVKARFGPQLEPVLVWKSSKPFMLLPPRSAALGGTRQLKTCLTQSVLKVVWQKSTCSTQSAEGSYVAQTCSRDILKLRGNETRILILSDYVHLFITLSVEMPLCPCSCVCCGASGSASSCGSFTTMPSDVHCVVPGFSRCWQHGVMRRLRLYLTQCMN